MQHRKRGHCTMYKVMTPGPTQVPKEVLAARSLVCTNPDIDEAFCEFL